MKLFSHLPEGVCSFAIDSIDENSRGPAVSGRFVIEGKSSRQ